MYTFAVHLFLDFCVPLPIECIIYLALSQGSSDHVPCKYNYSNDKHYSVE